ncbi:reverse transcriptase domain-containing protein, partial [Tanacetum coccineum]
MDDEPMWAADRVVASTPGFAIIIPETANEFAIKGNHLTLVKGNQFDGRIKTDPHKHIHEFLGICDMFKYIDTENEAVRLMMFPLSLTGEAKTWLDELNEGTIETNYHGHNLSKGNIIKIFYHGLNKTTQEVLNAATGGIFLYKTPNQAYQLLEDKVLLKLDWAKNQKTKPSLKKTVAFADEGSSNSDTDKIMARIDAMTMKMDAQYKELQFHLKPNPDHNDDDIPMSRGEEAKFMQTFHRTHFYNDYRDSNRDNWRSSGRNDYNRDNYQSHSDDKLDLQKQLNDFIKAQHSTNSFVKDTFMDLKNKLETTTKNHQASIQNLEAKFDRLANKQSGQPSGSLPSNTQPNPKVLMSSTKFWKKILMLFSTKVVIPQFHQRNHPRRKIFVEFDEFMAMTADENSESEFDTEEPPFEKINFNTDYKIKTSLEEPPMDFKLKPLPDNLEYAFLEEPSFLSMIISSQLSEESKNKLISILKKHKQAFAWKTTDIPRIFPSFCKHKIQLLEDKKPVVQKQRRLNPNMQEVVSEAGLEVDKAKIKVISKLPPPTNIKGIRSFLRHAGFYRRFIKDFSKIACPLTKLLKKDTPFEFNDECHNAFKLLKEKLTCAPVIVSANWNLPFELMCDASDFAVGAILEFDIEIKDRKGTENVVADHLSRIENDETSDYSEVDDNFPGETLMEISTRDEPWFADFANYLVSDIIPKGMTYQQKNKFFSDLKHYFWEEPYLFKVCFDGMIRRCVSGLETQTILDQCHHGPTGGHYGPNTTAKKVLDSGFYWPTVIKEAHTQVRLCEACQKTGNISKHDEMPLNSIQ